MRAFRRLFWFLIPLFGLAAAPAHGETFHTCTTIIASLPTVITAQGVYCLNHDLATAITSGNAIDIQTNNVTVDCNDFKIGGLAAGAGTATYGIYANNRANETVRRCNIRGFYFGIEFTGASSFGHLVEDSRFDGNTYMGMLVAGNSSVVRRNRVFDSGKSSTTNSAFGIYTQGAVDVLDNSISGVTARVGGNGYAIGIQSELANSRQIVGNGVRDLVKDGSGASKAIYTPSSDRVTIRDNDLVGDNDVSSEGIRCQSANGRVMDNTISGFGGAIVICHDSGGNAVIP